MRQIRPVFHRGQFCGDPEQGVGLGKAGEVRGDFLPVGCVDGGVDEDQRERDHEERMEKERRHQTDGGSGAQHLEDPCKGRTTGRAAQEQRSDIFRPGPIKAIHQPLDALTQHGILAKNSVLPGAVRQRGGIGHVGVQLMVQHLAARHSRRPIQGGEQVFQAEIFPRRGIDGQRRIRDPVVIERDDLAAPWPLNSPGPAISNFGEAVRRHGSGRTTLRKLPAAWRGRSALLRDDRQEIPSRGRKQSAVAQLQVGDDEQGHERQRHERRGES